MFEKSVFTPEIFIPPIVDNVNNSKAQLFSTYSWESKCWLTSTEEFREFLIIGHHASIKQACDNAYLPLKSYNMPGFTWRDDIGYNALKTYQVLNKRELWNKSTLLF